MKLTSKDVAPNAGNHAGQNFPIRRVGDGELHHFFGYYNKTTWDRSGRLFLSNRVPMMTGDLNGQQECAVGYFDLCNDDKFHEIGRTKAWNWQMGCQLQWLQSKGRTRIIYNKHAQSRSNIFPDFCSVIHDVTTGEDSVLPLPVYVVAPNGEYALCINYSRLQVTHKTIGYKTHGPEPQLEKSPADDGIYKMDIRTGEYQLLISLRQLTEHEPRESMAKAMHWVTHLEISPDSQRYLFLHRWTERVEDETCFLHRLYTMALDGTDLRLLECTDHPLPQLAENFDPTAVGTYDYEQSEYQISHPAWTDSHSIIVWAPHDGEIHYHLYEDENVGKVSVIGRDTLTENGHMTFSSDGEWLLTDTYPDAESNRRRLLLYNVKRNESHILGHFYTPPDIGKHNRCDLHPRWSPDNHQVSIDSVHDGARQQYIVDVSGLTGGL